MYEHLSSRFLSATESCRLYGILKTILWPSLWGVTWNDLLSVLICSSCNWNTRGCKGTAAAFCLIIFASCSWVHLLSCYCCHLSLTLEKQLFQPSNCQIRRRRYPTSWMGEGIQPHELSRFSSFSRVQTAIFRQPGLYYVRWSNNTPLNINPVNWTCASIQPWPMYVMSKLLAFGV